MMHNLGEYISQGVTMELLYGSKILFAILILIGGLWIIKKTVLLISKSMHKKGVEIPLTAFTTTLFGLSLRILLFVSVAGMVGVETTSFVIIIGAVGLALQGTLANFAGGVLILIFRPYRVGDLIKTQGHLGDVKEIQIFVTKLLTPENKTAIIPNGPISNGDITNFTTEGLFRMDITFGISCKANIKAARKALMQVMIDHLKVLKKPAPFAGVSELANNSINLGVRPFTIPQDYWEVFFDIYGCGKKALDSTKIEIPFPQLNIHFNQPVTLNQSDQLQFNNS